MKVFLDDLRATPAGWVRCYWPSEVIELLKTGKVKEVSLDHDLGDDRKGTGYDVIKWIEKQVANTDFVPPSIRIHTANPVAMDKMLAGAEAIYRMYKMKMRLK